MNDINDGTIDAYHELRAQGKSHEEAVTILTEKREKVVNGS